MTPASSSPSRTPRVSSLVMSGARVERSTYRDADVPEGRAALAVSGLILGLLLLLPVAIVAFAKGFSLADRGEGALGLALFSLSSISATGAIGTAGAVRSA